MIPLEKAIDDIRRNLARLESVEKSLYRVRGELESLPGTFATDLAIAGIGSARVALDQAEHELELEAGVYLTGEPPAPTLDVPEVEELPICPWCGTVEGMPHAWVCPKPRRRR